MKYVLSRDADRTQKKGERQKKFHVISVSRWLTQRRRQTVTQNEKFAVLRFACK
jgi:hypothetical protein